MPCGSANYYLVKIFTDGLGTLVDPLRWSSPTNHMTHKFEIMMSIYFVYSVNVSSIP